MCSYFILYELTFIFKEKWFVRNVFVLRMMMAMGCSIKKDIRHLLIRYRFTLRSPYWTHTKAYVCKLPLYPYQKIPISNKWRFYVSYSRQSMVVGVVTANAASAAKYMTSGRLQYLIVHWCWFVRKVPFWRGCNITCSGSIGGDDATKCWVMIMTSRIA